MVSSQPADQYAYLIEARRHLFDRVRALSPAQYAKQFPFGHGSVRATLVHMAAIEWWYTSMLEGRTAPKTRPAADTPSPFRRFSRTGFPPLETAWGRLAERTRRALRGESDWRRPVEDWWITKRWRRGIKTTAAGVAIQLILHEVHHRAQVMAMLRQLGQPVQSINYSLVRWGWFAHSRARGESFTYSPARQEWRAARGQGRGG